MESRVALIAFIDDAVELQKIFPDWIQENSDEWIFWTHKIGEDSKGFIRGELEQHAKLGFFVFVSEGIRKGSVKMVAYFDNFRDASRKVKYKGKEMKGEFHFTQFRWFDRPLDLKDFKIWDTGKSVESQKWLRGHYLYVVDPIGGIIKKQDYRLIREAVETIGGLVNYNQIIDYVTERKPTAKPDSLRSVIRAFTVNNEMRIKGYPENQQPRVYDPRYDILYQPEKGVGEFELYNSKIHGYWAICKTGTDANEWGLEVVNTGLSPPKPKLSSSPPKIPKPKKSVKRPKRPVGHQERIEYDEFLSKIERNPEVIEWVKTVEGSRCQICGRSIESPDGSRSVDLHHIWPLGKPHNGFELGFDRDDNAICLCPNHHREMHMGLFHIEPSTYRIVYHDKKNPHHNQELNRNPSHTLNEDFLLYHKKTLYEPWYE